MRGLNWLIASQAWLLACVLAYVLWQLNSYNPALAREFLDLGADPNLVNPHSGNGSPLTTIMTRRPAAAHDARQPRQPGVTR